MNELISIITSAIMAVTGFVGGVFDNTLVPYRYDGSGPYKSLQLGATNFPTSLDSLTNPSGTDSVATVSHSGQHTNANDAIEALEAKLGITSSTAIANSILAGNSAGSSIWTTFATTTQLSSTNLLITGSSTLQNFSGQTGTLGNLLVNGSSTLQAFSGVNYLALGSTTLQTTTMGSTTVRTNFLTSNATTTDLHVSNLASTTNLRANTAIFGNTTIDTLTVSACTGCGGNYSTIGVTATTSVVAGDAVMVAPTTGTVATTTGNGTSSDFNFGVSGTSRIAQSFNKEDVGIVNMVSLDLKKTGSPTDQVIVQIMAGDASLPDDTVLASGYVSGASLTTSYASTTILLNKAVYLNAGSKYWVALSRTSGVDDGSNNYGVLGSGASTWANGIANRDDAYSGAWNANWDAGVRDFVVRPGFAGIGKMYGGISNYETRFFGFAIGTYATGTTAQIAVAGAPDFFTGLTAGNIYYAAQTAGAIQTTSVGSGLDNKLCIAVTASACRIK